MKTRTTSFPKMSLVSARKVMEGALKFGKNWTKEEFAGYGSKKGASSARSGAFANRLAALKNYGLITTTKDSVFPTELCGQLIHYVNEDERREAYAKAFLNVDVFRKIYEDSKHNEGLPKASIQSNAVTRYGVSRDPKVLSSFMHSFITSGVEAELINEVDADTIVLQSRTGIDNSDAPQPDEPANSSPAKLQKTGEVSDVLTTGELLPSIKQGMNAQGVDHRGKDWRLVVSFTSSLTIKSDVRKKIRELIAQADEVADTFYDLEEKGASDG